jgi:hypothetical protein
LLCTAKVFAQNDSTGWKSFTTKQKLFTVGISAQQLISAYIQYNWWWDEGFNSFRFEKGDHFYNNYHYGMDKAGHFFVSYMYFNSISELMRWSDFSDRARLRTAFWLSAFWAVSIELGDGVTQWGYSWHDLAANFSGIGMAYLQSRYPYMSNIKFKMSYWPTRYYRDNGFKGWTLTNDYRGHMYWMTFDIHNMLPENTGKWWPPFLNLAVGYGVDPESPKHHFITDRAFAIGLDWNLGAIKTKNKTLHAVKQLADYFHYPAPGYYWQTNKAGAFYPLLVR